MGPAVCGLAAHRPEIATVQPTTSSPVFIELFASTLTCQTPAQEEILHDFGPHRDGVFASRPPDATSVAVSCQWDRLPIVGIRLSVAIQLEPTPNPGGPGRIAIRRERSQGALRRTHRTVEVPICRQ